MRDKVNKFNPPKPGDGWTRGDGEEFFGKEGILECQKYYEAKLRERHRGECHAPECKEQKIGFSKYCPKHFKRLDT